MPDASDTAQGLDARPNPRRRRAWLGAVRVVALLAAVAVAFVGCGGGGSDSKAKPNRTPTATTLPPTATTLPPGYSLVAQVKGPQIGIYDSPSAPTPSKTLPNPWLLNEEADKPIPQVFLVEEQRQDGWVKVLLAERPNGSTGWVHAAWHDDWVASQAA